MGIIILSCSHLWHSGRQKGIHSIFIFTFWVTTNGTYLVFILCFFENELFESTACISIHFSPINLGNWSFVIWYKCFSSIGYLTLISTTDKDDTFIIQRRSLVSPIYFSLLHMLTHLQHWLCSDLCHWRLVSLILELHTSGPHSHRKGQYKIYSFMSDLFCLMYFLSLPPKCVFVFTSE